MPRKPNRDKEFAEALIDLFIAYEQKVASPPLVGRLLYPVFHGRLTEIVRRISLAILLPVFIEREVLQRLGLKKPLKNRNVKMFAKGKIIYTREMTKIYRTAIDIIDNYWLQNPPAPSTGLTITIPRLPKTVDQTIHLLYSIEQFAVRIIAVIILIGLTIWGFHLSRIEKDDWWKNVLMNISSELLGLIITILIVGYAWTNLYERMTTFYVDRKEKAAELTKILADFFAREFQDLELKLNEVKSGLRY